MVLRIDDMDPAPAVHGQRPGMIEQARLSTMSAPDPERHALLTEPLDAIVPELGDIQIAC